MKLENREKVMDIMNQEKRLALDLNNIQKLQECNIVEVKDVRGYISIKVDAFDFYPVLQNMANRIRETLKVLDAQLEEL